MRRHGEATAAEEHLPPRLRHPHFGPTLGRDGVVEPLAVAPLVGAVLDLRAQPDEPLAPRRSHRARQRHATREAAEKGLAGAGWDGYVACRTALRSDCPETRARAVRVCGRYLVPPMPKTPCGIYRLNGLYVVKVPKSGGGVTWYTNEYVGDPLFHPQAQALISHWYMLRAVREAWDGETRSGGRAAWARDFKGHGPVFYKYRTTHLEERATQLMVRDLLSRGVSREWVAWLLDDMARRQCTYPPPMGDPPWWLLESMGFRSPN